MQPKTDRDDFVPFFRPSFSEAEENAVIRVLRSGWLTTGKEAIAFEKEFAEYTGSPHSLAVNSASSGLMLAMDAFGIGAGTKILTTPYTFVSTATSARHLGAEIVYADIEGDSYNIDPEGIEQALSADPDIRAIVPVHIAGNVCKMDEIASLGTQYGVPVIEDAAHAFPALTRSGYAGTLADAGVYSFYATKTITTGEGGMINIKDGERAQRISLMRSHGINRTIWDRYTSKTASWEYDVVAEGWKCNLPDILAAIGREQLKKADDFFRKRKAVAEFYTREFAGRDWLELPPDGPGNAWHLYLLRIVPEKLTIGRDEFAEKLQEAGLGISVHFIPHFEMTYFRQRYGLDRKDFPNAAKQYDATISLPFWPDMSAEQQERVVRTVLETGDAHLKRR
ncbi:MAG TPA: DegT/DnrJ/EryC1/StrS aminotransferase family protein [Treponemataceae bacterium]|jgi:dTDP-4-amino-4,6-dideoxygalactose transaminase|nr:MAG: UDP-4-amino-4-deoxy-L-arabinose--oxoglutarate aminotransferase [Spirochaetes bacterium ADurb.Bin269]HOC29559.1 DegT/DnrJ/EryC1/StrS aminotransferase family protein [Treponemataceae bacterium]HQL32939.1 DegT/DnrJ/EryC1/StrS aminotransferase family protein [Treponemataceae bacterium]